MTHLSTHVCENPSCTNLTRFNHGRPQTFCSQECYRAAPRARALPAYCRHCHKLLTQREDETWVMFRKRVFCDRLCYLLARRKPTADRHCTACGSLLAQREYETRKRFLGRSTCNRECAGIASMNGNIVWADKTDELAAMIWAHMSFAEIGNSLGISRNAAIGRAHRMGIVHPNSKRGPEPTTLLQRLDALDVFPPPARCVYPVGHPRDQGFGFCGAQSHAIGEPYCTEHTALCYIEEKAAA